MVKHKCKGKSRDTIEESGLVTKSSRSSTKKRKIIQTSESRSTKRTRTTKGQVVAWSKTPITKRKSVVVEHMDKRSRSNKEQGKTYRSNLLSIIRMMKTLKLRKAHIRVLKRTPFWFLFDALRKNKLPTNKCRKDDAFVSDIIKTYVPREHGFKIGGKFVRLTRNDVMLIFGISCGDKAMNLTYGKKESVEFVKKRLLKTTRLTAPATRTLIEDLIDREEEEAIEDVVRLTCLYLCHTLFFTTGTTLKWAYLKHIEDLNLIKNYDWCEAIRTTLLSSIEKHHGDPEKVSGCVMVLLYCLCEHTKVVRSVETEAFPRILKWNIPDMHKVFKKTSIRSLSHNQVKVGNLVMTSKESSIYDGEVEAVEQIMETENEEVEMMETGDEEGDTENEEGETEDEKGESMGNQSHEQVVIESDTCGNSGADESDYELRGTNGQKESIHDMLAGVTNSPCNSDGKTYNMSKSDTFYCNATIQDADSDGGKVQQKEVGNQETDIHYSNEIIQDVGCMPFTEHEKDGHRDVEPIEMAHENDWRTLENHRLLGEVSKLKGTIQQMQGQINEMAASDKQVKADHLKAIDVKDMEIALLHEHITLLMKEKAQLIDILDDIEVQKVTQQHRSEPPKDGALLSKGEATQSKRKMPPWKGKEAPSRRKMPRSEKRATSSEGPISKAQEVLSMLSKEDQLKISQLWKTGSTSECVWVGSEYGSCVYVQDIWLLVMEKGISCSIIDSYAEELMRSQRQKLAEKQGQDTQGSLSQLSYIVMSSCFDLAMAKNPGDPLDRMLDNWIKKTRSFRYVIFPIYMQSHWTVLVQDRKEGTWRFYNSFQPRGGRDCHFDAAKKMKKFVEEYEERNSNGLVSAQDFQEVVSVRSSPQLISGSLDCGVIVIYIMRRVLWDKEIESNLPNDECKKIRAEILHEFLSDEEMYPWTQEANKE